MRNLTFAAAAFLAVSAQAETLPLALAQEALTETLDSCAAKGFKVAVSVVDTDGVIKVQARGDGSPVHSQRFSFRKAFTAVSMSTMVGVDTSSALIKFLTANNPLANVVPHTSPSRRCAISRGNSRMIRWSAIPNTGSVKACSSASNIATQLKPSSR